MDRFRGLKVLNSQFRASLRTGLLYGLILLPLFWYACRKDASFNTSPEARLKVSRDTLLFDTIFTSYGSATRVLKLYNPYDERIRISRIWLKEGSASFFNLNVDGISGDDQQDVEVLPHDSIYVFVEVTIDPDQPPSASPFVIEEELMWEVNGGVQTIWLQAWGQNANYIPGKDGKNGLALLTCDLGEITWDDPKPYVIFGVLIIDSCTVRIPAGQRIYIHGGIANNPLGVYNDGIIYVNNKGRIIAEGTAEDPILFTGDRLESDYNQDKGQWGGIRLGPLSKNNAFSFVTISNSIVGIQVDSLASATLKNVRIYNTSASGLVAYHATVNAENCLIHSNEGYGVQLEFGGSYTLNYCTVASFGNTASALRFSNSVCADPPLCTAYFPPYPLKLNANNCIFYGTQLDEVEPDNYSFSPADFSYTLRNCIVRVKDILRPEYYPDFLDNCQDCINTDYETSIFQNPDSLDFRLDSLSVGIEKALPIPGIPADLIGFPRDPVKPDIGCLEKQD